ncbi:metabotropic Glutamate Receptor [Carabus blaptoides fortunei]
MSEYKCESGKPPVYVPHKPVTVVIGASFSVVSIMVANILRLFKIPQISYASTSTELSDKSRFEYFSRVVPPDNFQAQAMAEIVRELGWKYVSTVAVEGDYGEKGIASFISIAAEAGICIGVSEKILRNSRTEDFDRIIERLLQKSQARAVIMFVDEDNTRKLLQASIRANKTGHFLWIGSDSWGAKMYPVRDQEWAAEGAITILPHRTAIEGFDRYYRSLRPRLDTDFCNASQSNMPHGNRTGIELNCRNVWFREFWSQHNKCSFDNGKYPKKCTGTESISDYDQEGLVPFVVDAVYAAAHALHDVIRDECGRQGTEVKFNSDGDAFGSYNIYQYQRNNEKYDYIQIGSWKEILELNLSITNWRESNEIPHSICSEPCPVGHIRNYQDQCCWICVSCREDAYVFNDTCRSCQPGYAPNTDKSDCVKLAALVIEWLNPWALVPLAFSGIGILCTLFTTCVFIR